MSPARKGPKRARQRKSEVFRPGLSDAQLLQRVIGYYRGTLETDPTTLAFLRRLGMSDDGVLERLQLGFSDRSLGLQLPERNFKAGALLRHQLQHLGVVRPSGHEHFRGCVTLPMRDEQGQVVDVLGYAVGRRLRDVYPTLSLTGQVDAVWQETSLGEVVSGTEAPSSRTPAPAPAVPDSPPGPPDSSATELQSEHSDHEMWARVAEHYARTLQQAPDVGAELQGIGLAEATLLEHFKLGFSDWSFGRRLPPATTSAGVVLRAQLRRLGVIDERGAETLHGHFTVPLVDPQGALTGLHGYRRGAGTDRPRTRVVGQGAVHGSARGSEVIICDCPFDAMAFWARGYRHVIGCAGPDGAVDHVPQALEGAAVERALVAFRDEHEPQAAALAERLAEDGLTTLRVKLPLGLDALGYARQAADPAQALGTLLRGAEWMAGPRPAQAQEQRPVAPRGPDDGEGPETEPPIEEERTEREWIFRIEDRRWRVRGLENNLGHNRLRVNLLVTRSAGGDTRVHVDTVELYQARQRATLIKQAATELGLDEGVIKRDVGKLLLRLEELQEEQIRAALEPRKAEVVMTDADRKEALELLRDPALLTTITDDLTRCGVVGEDVNKRVVMLAATSRKLRQPLGVTVQSSSAAGKSTLTERVLSFVPPEDLMSYSAMTGQSLYYLGQADLRHKVLSIAEEEGVQHASYALKLLQSQGELTIASTGKDAVTGRLVTQDYKVQGPVAIFMTTTSVDVDEELLNRCIVLTVDEGREQTRAIHALQRRTQTLEGLVEARERERLTRLHQNAQRLLEPLQVVNPFADRLTFSDHQTRTRRDHQKYLSLIQAVALLHQHQRDIRETRVAGDNVRYIEVTAQDIEIADGLAHAVLGRSLDELPPQTRNLLSRLHEVVTVEAERQRISRPEVRFQRRWLRDRTGWGDTQLKVHLKRLVDLEYVLAHRSRDSRGLTYELAYDGQGQDGSPFVLGLGAADAYDIERSGSRGKRSAPGRGPVGGRSAGGRPAKPDVTARKSKRS